jgi:hypothetical protein
MTSNHRILNDVTRRYRADLRIVAQQSGSGSNRADEERRRTRWQLIRTRSVVTLSSSFPAGLEPQSTSAP